MPLVNLPIQPGINTEQSDRTVGAQYKDGNLVRFRQGFPEKVGGWIRSDPTLTIPGNPRDILDWVTIDGKKYAAFGTTSGMYLYDSDTKAIFTITPDGSEVVVVNELDNPFQTLQSPNQPKQIWILHPAHTAQVDAVVSIANSLPFLPFDNTGSPENITKLLRAHIVDEVMDNDHFGFSTDLDATIEAVNLGGDAVWIEVVPNNSNVEFLNYPFLTLANSSNALIMTVVHPFHGLASIDKVAFRGCTQDGELTTGLMNALFDITTIIDDHHYEVTLPAGTTPPTIATRQGGQEVSFIVYPAGAATSTLNNPFTSTVGSRTLTVSDPSSTLQTGDLVMFTGCDITEDIGGPNDSSLGGISQLDLNDAFRVTRIDDDSYTIVLNDLVPNGSITAKANGGGTTIDIIRWAADSVPDEYGILDPWRFRIGDNKLQITILNHGFLNTNSSVDGDEMLDIILVSDDALIPSPLGGGASGVDRTNLNIMHWVTRIDKDRISINLPNIFTGDNNVPVADGRMGGYSGSDYSYVKLPAAWRGYASSFTENRFYNPIITKAGSSIIAVLAPGNSTMTPPLPSNDLYFMLQDGVELTAGLPIDVTRPSYQAEMYGRLVNLFPNWVLVDLAIDVTGLDPTWNTVAQDTTRGGGTYVDCSLERKGGADWNNGSPEPNPYV